MLDIASLSKAVYNRIKTDEQGEDVRDAFGGGVVGVIRAERLSQSDLPGRPLLAFRDGVVADVSRGHRQPLYQWYIYDERVQGYARINTLIKLLAEAYEAEPRIQPDGGGVVSSIAVSLGQSTEDPALNLLVRSVTVILNTT
jgi:hypothetical protein